MRIERSTMLSRLTVSISAARNCVSTEGWHSAARLYSTTVTVRLATRRFISMLTFGSTRLVNDDDHGPGQRGDIEPKAGQGADGR